MFMLHLPGQSCATVCETNERHVKQAVNSLMGHCNISSSDYYILYNGRISTDEDIIHPLHSYHVTFRVLGGKGGFGSMLRALGAQIEKTTNREACRDLSGRRMRDVNNEKRLREWVAKSSEREKAKEERRRERRERMKAPRYKFDDPEYEEQKSSTAERLDDALQQGLQRTSKGPTVNKGKKRRAVDAEVDPKKAKEWLGIDVGTDSDNSSSAGSDSERGAAAGNVPDSISKCELLAAVGGQLPEYSSSSSSLSGDEVEKASCAATCATTRDSSVVEDDDDDAQEPDAQSDGCADAMTSLNCVRGGSDPGFCMIDEKKSQENGETSKDEFGLQESKKTELSPSSVEKAVSLSTDCLDVLQIAESLELDVHDSAESLEELGLEVLKAALMARGVKCGGTLQERARRLYSLKGLKPDEIPPSLLAKPVSKK